MQLNPIVDNFLKHNTPKWHDKLSGKHDRSDLRELGRSDLCIVGELYGMTSDYMAHDHVGHDYCRECSNYSIDIWCAVSILRTEDFDGEEFITYRAVVKRLRSERVFNLNKLIEAWADHVKREHPELLKLEKEITN